MDISPTDLAWLIEQAELALELNPFCATGADYDRLEEIKGVVGYDHRRTAFDR